MLKVNWDAAGSAQSFPQPSYIATNLFSLVQFILSREKLFCALNLKGVGVKNVNELILP